MVYRSGPAGNGPVGIICPTGEIPAKTGEIPAKTGEIPAKTGEIPAKTGEIPVKTGEKVTIFLENNFLQKNDPKYEII